MSKTLVVYYSWSGQTKKLAQRIHQFLPNSDLLELKVAPDTFSSDMYETAAIAEQQLKNNSLPRIVTELPNFSEYDSILVGGPVWSYSPSTPVLSFLDNLEKFPGKVAPFYTSIGNNGDYEKKFANENSALNVLPGNANGYQLKEWIQQFE